MERIPLIAQVVIVGSGIMGVSVACHLTMCGMHDVMLLECR